MVFKATINTGEKSGFFTVYRGRCLPLALWVRWMKVIDRSKDYYSFWLGLDCSLFNNNGRH